MTAAGRARRGELICRNAIRARMRQNSLMGGGERMAALLRRRDFAWINRRVGVVGEEGTAFCRPFFFVLRPRPPPKSRLATRQGMERLGDVRGLGAMTAVEFVEDPATRAPSPRLANRVVAEAEKRGLILEAALSAEGVEAARTFGRGPAAGAPCRRRNSLTVPSPPL
jgi:hypothetical protein